MWFQFSSLKVNEYQINNLYEERYKIFITLWVFYIHVCHKQYRVLVSMLYSRSPVELLFIPHNAIGQVLQSPHWQTRHWMIAFPNGEALMNCGCWGAARFSKMKHFSQRKSTLAQHPLGKKTNCINNLRAWLGMSEQVLDYHTLVYVWGGFF